MTVDNKADLLLRSVMQQPLSAGSSHLFQLAEELTDWDSLLGAARQHRILPLLYLHLADVAPAIPPLVWERLQTAYQRNTFHSLANAAELLAILNLFDQAMIPAMPFKGVVLAAAIYQDLAARTAGDLDLIINQRDLQRASAILFERGFDLTIPDRHEYRFERESDGMIVELRWKLDLTYQRFHTNLGMHWVWPHHPSVILAGARVPSISPEINLLALCMHGSKHIWSRLLWICDVAQLIASVPDLDWIMIVEESKRTGLERTLALGVLLAHRIGGAVVPEIMLKRFVSDSTACRLAEHIEKTLFTAPGTPPEGGVPYNIKLLGLRDRAKFFLSPAFLRPNERDRAAIALPPSLEVLYYAVRPIRILCDRSPRA